MAWFHRVWNALRPGRVEGDIDRELSFHVAERADALRAAGVGDDEAIRLARRQLGNVIVQRERTRDVDVAAWLDALLRHVRLAVRTLTRTPGFSATVVVMLALGIGANSAVFSAVDAVLLRPLPFPEGDRLVQLTELRKAAGDAKIAPVRLEEWSRLNTTFDAIAGYVSSDVVDTTSDLPERIRQAIVTPRFFDVLGIGPERGRSFTTAEHRFGTPVVILISDRIWRARGADPSALGQVIRSPIGNATIVGIMPPFLFPDRDVDVWTPMPVNAPYAQSRSGGWFTGIGRLKRGVTLEQARQDLRAVQTRLGEQYPDTDRDVAVRIEPLKETVVAGARGSLWLVFGAVSVLLLIACTNIAALMLSRGAGRTHEITLRYALGASRTSVAAQMLTEAGVLALAGAALGLLVATGASRAFQVLAPELPRLNEVAFDQRSFLFTAGSAVFVALVCGLIPAIRSVRSDGTVPRSSHTRVVRPRHALQWLLVGVQVALSVALLAGAGLLLRSVDALSRVDAGFDAARVLTFHVTGRFGEEGGNWNRIVQRINGTLDQLVALPGIEAAATTTMPPGVPGQEPQVFVVAEGRADTEPPLIAENRVVSPSYFETMRIPLLGGRLCGRPEDSRGTTEVMVNRRFADAYFPGKAVIGLHLGGTSPNRIVGIVGDARERGIDREPVPTVYACFSAPNPVPWFLVRTSGDPLVMVRAIRQKLKELEPLRPVYDVASLEDRIEESYAQNRLRSVLLTLTALAALGLVSAGVYGTLSYAASLRRREVALHLALGASRGEVVRRLVRMTVRIVCTGCAFGVALSLMFGRTLSTMLYGVSPYDPVTLSSVVALVIAIAAVAALIPAARVAFVQPMRVLREE
jgi:putative ABC transport system permease protein